MKYEVFGRVDPGDDLIQIGTVDAQNDQLGRAYARATYDEEDWEDLLVCRRDHILETSDTGQVPDTPGEST